METKKIILNEELIKLKHNVLLERIKQTNSKLEIIANVVNCKNEIKSIEIIKEQYEKMYQAILTSREYDKYQEVENTIVQKLAQIEYKLDKDIYKTSKNCEEVFANYMKEIEKYNNLDEELEKIKELKKILRSYKTYISQEQEKRISYNISTVKFEILYRKYFKKIVYLLPSYISNFLKLCDTTEEKEVFEFLLKRTEEIKVYIESDKKRLKKADAFTKTLYEIEKINKKIDTTEILNMQEQIQEMQKQLDVIIANVQYSKYLEIEANIKSNLEKIEKRIMEIGELDYILNTVSSKEYFLKAILEQFEKNPKKMLEYAMELYDPNKQPEEDDRYNKAIERYEWRTRKIKALNGEISDWDIIFMEPRIGYHSDKQYRTRTT